VRVVGVLSEEKREESGQRKKKQGIKIGELKRTRDKF
jgi:hypothetical protein